MTSDPHHQFPAVLAGEEPGQRRGHFVETFDDVDGSLQLSLSKEVGERGFGLLPPIVEVHHDEAFHADALGHEETWNACRSTGWLQRVVLRDHAATGDTSEDIHS